MVHDVLRAPRAAASAEGLRATLLRYGQELAEVNDWRAALRLLERRREDIPAIDAAAAEYAAHATLRSVNKCCLHSIWCQTVSYTTHMVPKIVYTQYSVQTCICSSV